MAGTDPADANSVLKIRLVATLQGSRLSWNAQPGFIYQVQTTSDLKTWTDVGDARFAVAADDSISVAGTNDVAYYRVIRLR